MGLRLIMEIGRWEKVLEKDLEEVSKEVRDLVQVPAVICLTGELGAGKTTFCKFFTENSLLQSTSYSLVAESGQSTYADLYRLNDVNELDELELPLYLEGKDYFLCEWGVKYADQFTRLLGGDFSFYELTIRIKGHEYSAARNYGLCTL